MQLYPIADIVGDNAAHAISATSKMARLLALTATGGNARLGDNTVAAARGVELPADKVVLIYADQADFTNRMDLLSQYAYVPNGTTLTIAYGV